MSIEDKLKNEVSERVSKLSDEDLIRMLQEHDEYTPFALAVAENELSKRGGKVPAQKPTLEVTEFAFLGLKYIKTLRGSPKPDDLFQPFMPDVGLLSDMNKVFEKARHEAASDCHFLTSEDHPPQEVQRSFVIVTPCRKVMIVPVAPPKSRVHEVVKVSEEIWPSSQPLNISVISYTYVEALQEDWLKCIPFMGYLYAFSSAGHNVVVFEGHPSAFESGIRGSDVLIVDSGMTPFLLPNWPGIAQNVMQENSKIYIHDRETYSLMHVIMEQRRSFSKQPWWKFW